MSTACTIGVQTDNGILATYCVNDGYLDCAGVKLYKYFSDEEKAQALVRLGAIESLGSAVEFITSVAEMAAVSKQSILDILSLVTPPARKTDDGKIRTVIDTCFREVQQFKTEDEFWDYCPFLNVEYYYLFKEDNWYVRAYMPDVGKYEILPFVEAFKREVAYEEQEDC